jgi:hypothetical protein
MIPPLIRHVRVTIEGLFLLSRRVADEVRLEPDQVCREFLSGSHGRALAALGRGRGGPQQLGGRVQRSQRPAPWGGESPRSLAAPTFARRALRRWSAGANSRQLGSQGWGPAVTKWSTWAIEIRDPVTPSGPRHIQLTLPWTVKRRREAAFFFVRYCRAALRWMSGCFQWRERRHGSRRCAGLPTLDARKPRYDDLTSRR